jgi:hypothetical protein
MNRFWDVLGWICTALVGVLFMLSAAAAITASPDSETASIYRELGMWELRHLYASIQFVSILLFVVPRTSVVGLVFCVGYLAGALATVLTHSAYDQTIPVLIALGLVSIAGALRLPELTCRLRGQKYLALDTSSMVRS